MKPTKLFSLILLFMCVSFTAKASCDSCSVTANFYVNEDPYCALILVDLSTTDSCSTHVFSIVNYGNGITDTIYGDTIPDRFKQGTYYMCLTAVAVYTDSLGSDTCYDTFCRYVTRNICHTPGPSRLKSSSIQELAKPYPNPANGSINIPVRESGNIVRIFSMEGKLVYTTSTLNTSLLNVNIGNWSRGVYIIKIDDDTSTEMRKIIVE